MSDERYDLTVSIVTYLNDQTELLKAVDSVLGSEGVELKLYIVDNSPTDEIGRILRDERIEYIFNRANLGFGAGHNIAMRKASAISRYHLAMNPDICFGKHVLSELTAYMDAHPQVGQILPKVLTPEGICQRRNRRLLPSPRITFLQGLSLFAKTASRRMDEYFTRFVSYDRAVPAPFFGGCFIFLRTSAIRKVGLFDERFFMYYEDADYSRRMYCEAGNIYYPEVSITHAAHTESHTNPRLFFVHVASAIKYYNKWGWFDRHRKRINEEYIARFSEKRSANDPHQSQYGNSNNRSR